MDQVEQTRSEALQALQAASSLEALESVRVATLGKKGSLTGLLKQLGTLPVEQRKEFGAKVNVVKAELEQAIEARKTSLQGAALDRKLAEERIDVTLPARPQRQGFIHPISQTIDEIVAIFGDMGFVWADGPDIEDDWHNFTALNIPP